MLKGLFEKFWKTPKAPETKQLETLRSVMNRAPDAHEITSLYPQITPLALMEEGWPGPIQKLGDLPFSLSWSIAEPGNYFRYVDWDMSQFWENSGIDWKAKAMENLKTLAQTKLYAGYWDRSDGSLYALSLLHDDAMGPSRLLVPGLFSDLFGDDYTVAIPERTCAIVHHNSLNDEEAVVANAAIDKCFAMGTEPMSSERFDPKRFWVI